MIDTQTVPPKAFISHAHADKERFVVSFATRLRSKGVNAWLDQWEMNPGDSLVDKIFEEGLKDCQAFIVVLSDNSVDSRWVQEELNAGMVRKIEKQTKLIAVRLDGCQMPECRNHVLWQEIPDPENYDSEFERIVNAIFGVYEKPEIGEPPVYTQPNVLKIGDLARIDSVVFEAACQIALESDNPLINPAPLLAKLAATNISEEQIIETLEILGGRGYIELHRTMGLPHVYAFSVKALGFDRYVRSAIPDFNRILNEVALVLARRKSGNHRGIAQELKQPPYLVEHIFRVLGSNDLIKYAESMGGGLHMDVYSVSPELRRRLEEQ